MARSILMDPLDKYRWTVEIEGFTRFGFTICTVPGYDITTHNYAEGGAHLNPRNIIDAISYKPVTLSRGVTNDTSFAKWASGPFDLVQNNEALQESQLPDFLPDFVETVGTNLVIGGPALAASSSKYPFQYRRTVKINHCNRVGQAVVTYTLYNAFPISYTPASEFDSSADDGLSIETLILSYEGFDVRYTGLAGAAVSGFAGANF